MGKDNDQQDDGEGIFLQNAGGGGLTPWYRKTGSDPSERGGTAHLVVFRARYRLQDPMF